MYSTTIFRISPGLMDSFHDRRFSASRSVGSGSIYQNRQHPVHHAHVFNLVHQTCAGRAAAAHLVVQAGALPLPEATAVAERELGIQKLQRAVYRLGRSVGAEVAVAVPEPPAGDAHARPGLPNSTSTRAFF